MVLFDGWRSRCWLAGSQELMSCRPFARLNVALDVSGSRDHISNQP